MVTAKGDDAGQGLAPLGQAELAGVGGRFTREDAVVTLLDLLQGPGVVEPDGRWQ